MTTTRQVRKRPIRCRMRVGAGAAADNSRPAQAMPAHLAHHMAHVQRQAQRRAVPAQDDRGTRQQLLFFEPGMCRVPAYQVLYIPDIESDPLPPGQLGDGRL